MERIKRGQRKQGNPQRPACTAKRTGPRRDPHAAACRCGAGRRCGSPRGVRRPERLTRAHPARNPAARGRMPAGKEPRVGTRPAALAECPAAGTDAIRVALVGLGATQGTNDRLLQRRRSGPDTSAFQGTPGPGDTLNAAGLTAAHRAAPRRRPRRHPGTWPAGRAGGCGEISAEHTGTAGNTSRKNTGPHAPLLR